MKQVGQPPHQLARLECSDGRPWREIRHPVLMIVPSMRVLSLVCQVRGFLCVTGDTSYRLPGLRVSDWETEASGFCLP